MGLVRRESRRRFADRGAKIKVMQDSLAAANGPRCGLFDANGSWLSILHSIDLGGGVQQRLGPNGPQQQVAGYPALLAKHTCLAGGGSAAHFFRSGASDAAV